MPQAPMPNSRSAYTRRGCIAPARATREKPEAAEAESAHEGRQKDSQGDGGGPDDQLQKLIPDDFVN